MFLFWTVSKEWGVSPRDLREWDARDLVTAGEYLTVRGLVEELQQRRTGAGS